MRAKRIPLRVIVLILLLIGMPVSADYPLEIIELKGRQVEEIIPMIRPLVGKPLGNAVEEYKAGIAELQIYPNPPGPHSFVNIVLPAGEDDPSNRDNLALRVYDICGKQVYAGPYREMLPVSSFQQGFYIVSLTNRARSTKYTTKLLITK